MIENGKIKNYQAVVPSTWNAGPRDDADALGPYEASLVDNPVADPELPLEVLRTVHSFDPCLACDPPDRRSSALHRPGESVLMRIVVLGLGNILLRDEGVGVRVVEALAARYVLPAMVEVVDGGTTGMELLDTLAGCDHLLVCDAVQTGAPPASVVKLADAEVPALFQARFSRISWVWRKCWRP